MMVFWFPPIHGNGERHLARKIYSSCEKPHTRYTMNMKNPNFYLGHPLYTQKKTFFLCIVHAPWLFSGVNQLECDAYYSSAVVRNGCSFICVSPALECDGSYIGAALSLFCLFSPVF